MRNESRKEVTFYSLATQFENLGDCIINDLLMQECAATGELVVLCRKVPQWLMDRLRQQQNIMLCEGRAEFFGKLLQSLFFGHRVSFCFKPGHMGAKRGFLSATRLLGVLMFCFLMRRLGARVLRLGVSLDQYTFPERPLQAFIGRCHCLYGVRDTASLEYARQLGISRACYTPDMAFLLPVPEESRLPKATPERRLAVSFRERRWTSSSGACLGDLLKGLSRIAESSGRRLTLIQQVDFDSALSQRIQSEVSCDTFAFAASAESMDRVFRAHQESDLIVSNRLHALIFAWACGAIPVAVVDDKADRKIRYFFEQLGLSELTVEGGDPDLIISRVRSIDAGSEFWKKRLSEVFGEQQTVIRESLESWRRESASSVNEDVLQSRN